jgi:DNA-binding winged helix-turn-helix (wHTH) protein
MDVNPAGPLLRFSEFTLDLETGVLHRDGERVPLRPQASQVLLLLAQHRDRLVMREQIREAVWDHTVVEFDQAINACIREIRKTLGDTAEDPRFIETVPRRGYRFIAAAVTEPGSLAPVPHGSDARGRPWRWRLAAAAAGFLLLLTVSWGMLGRPSEAPLTVLVVPNGILLEGELAAFPDELMHEVAAALSASDADRLRVVPRTWSVRWDPDSGTVHDDGRTIDIDFVIWFNVGASDDSLRVELFIRQAGSPLTVWQQVHRIAAEGRHEAARAIAQEIAEAFARRN